jgi:arabinogalactan endo-1,4-beta-galactosidase
MTLLLLLAQAVALTRSEAADFAKGVDLSILKEAEDHGVVYRDHGKACDAISIFRSAGCNWVRLRLFVEPSGAQGQVNSLAYTLALAKRVKAAHLKFYFDFHYSDGWADPGHQVIPAAWKDMPEEQLLAKVHDYTHATLRAFQQADCLPDMVSVGNEITNGMMWPAGGPMDSERRWPPLTRLLAAAIRGVRDTAPASQIKIMLHVDKGGKAAVCENFFSHCRTAHLDYDVIGLSFYPFWHGTLDELADNLNRLSQRYGKDIYVAETGYDASGQQGKLPFPTTLQGQKDYLDRLMRIVAATPGGHGKGVFYWEPAWIDGRKWNDPDWSGTWENRALFGPDGNARPGLAAFGFDPGDSKTHSLPR